MSPDHGLQKGRFLQCQVAVMGTEFAFASR